VFSGDEDTRRVVNSVTNNNFFDFISKDFFDQFTEGFEFSFTFFEFFLFVFGVFKVESFFGTILEFFSVEFFKLLDNVFIDGVNHIYDFVSSFFEGFEERRVSNGLFRFSGNEIDVFLSFLHSFDIVFEGNEVFSGFSGVISQELTQFFSVGRIFVDSEFKVLGELFVEFFVIFGVFSDFREKFNTFFNDIFFDDLQDFILLEEFSGDVKGEIFGVDNSFNEGETVGDQVFTVIHDENSSDVQFDVILLLFGFEEVEGGSLGDEEQGFEFKLSFDGELFDGEVVFPIVGEGFVEGGVFFLGDGFGFSHPDGFGFILDFEFLGHFFNFLGFFGFFFFDFFFFSFFFLSFFFGFFIIIFNFFFGGFFDLELDFEIDEFRVFFDKVFESFFFKIFKIVLFKMKNDHRSSGKSEGVFFGGDGKGSSGRRFPFIAFLFFGRSRNDGDFVGDQESGIESNTKLSNHTNIGS